MDQPPPQSGQVRPDPARYGCGYYPPEASCASGPGLLPEIVFVHLPKATFEAVAVVVPVEVEAGAVEGAEHPPDGADIR